MTDLQKLKQAIRQDAPPAQMDQLARIEAQFAQIQRHPTPDLVEAARLKSQRAQYEQKRKDEIARLEHRLERLRNNG